MRRNIQIIDLDNTIYIIKDNIQIIDLDNTIYIIKDNHLLQK